jgi:hypothetical protein
LRKSQAKSLHAVASVGIVLCSRKVLAQGGEALSVAVKIANAMEATNVELVVRQLVEMEVGLAPETLVATGIAKHPGLWDFVHKVIAHRIGFEELRRECLRSFVGAYFQEDVTTRLNFVGLPWVKQAQQRNDILGKCFLALSWVDKCCGDWAKNLQPKLMSLHAHLSDVIAFYQIDQTFVLSFARESVSQMFAAKKDELDQILQTVLSKWECQAERFCTLLDKFRPLLKACQVWKMDSVEYLFAENTDIEAERKEVQDLLLTIRQESVAVVAICVAPSFHASQDKYAVKKNSLAAWTSEAATILSAFAFASVFMAPGKYPEQRDACLRMQKFAASLQVSVSQLPSALADEVRALLNKEPKRELSTTGVGDGDGEADADEAKPSERKVAKVEESLDKKSDTGHKEQKDKKEKKVKKEKGASSSKLAKSSKKEKKHKKEEGKAEKEKKQKKNR